MRKLRIFLLGSAAALSALSFTILPFEYFMSHYMYFAGLIHLIVAVSLVSGFVIVQAGE